MMECKVTIQHDLDSKILYRMFSRFQRDLTIAYLTNHKSVKKYTENQVLPRNPFKIFELKIIVLY